MGSLLGLLGLPKTCPFSFIGKERKSSVGPSADLIGSDGLVVDRVINALLCILEDSSSLLGQLQAERRTSWLSLACNDLSSSDIDWA